MYTHQSRHGSRSIHQQELAAGSAPRVQLREVARTTGSYAEAVQRLSPAGDGGKESNAKSDASKKDDKAPKRDLDYNVKTDKKTGEKTNPEQKDGKLPFKCPISWDGGKILSELTQIDDDPLTITDNKRCAAASVLATHIVAGPVSVGKVATATYVRMMCQLALASDMPDEVATNFKSLADVIAGIPARIAKQTVTYKDLRRLAHCMKLSVDFKKDSGTNTKEYKKLTGIGGGARASVGKTYTGFADLKKLAKGVKALKTWSYILAISTKSKEDGSVNHAVNLGYDGTVFLYDPWPRKGSQMMYFGKDDADIKEYFEAPDGTKRTWKTRELMQGA